MARLKPLPSSAVLKPRGFIENSQEGSHVKFVRRSGAVVDTAIVPRKHEVPVGTLRSILSQGHIDPDDWDKL